MTNRKPITESDGNIFRLMHFIGYKTYEINDTEIEKVMQVARKIFNDKEFFILKMFFVNGLSKDVVSECAEIKRERLNWYLRDIVIQLSKQRG